MQIPVESSISNPSYIPEPPEPAEGWKQIAKGSGYTVALRHDGTVACWGNNQLHQCNHPSVSGVVSLSTGSHHTAALLADGTVTCWGHDGNGQASPPPLRSVVRVQTGGLHSFAIHDSGEVSSWGWTYDLTRGVTSPLPPASQVREYLMHPYYAAALRHDGRVQCWGLVREMISLPWDLTTEAWLEFVGEYGYDCFITRIVPPYILNLPQYKTTRRLSRLAREN
jgi:alpha-tubulin suppressor-like RCC1 family protein